MNSIISKWKTRIRCQVANFGAIVDNVKGTHGSGENDFDDMSKALLEYRARYGQDFTMVDCWRVLRGHDTWKAEIPFFQSGIRKKVKGSTTTSGSTHSNFKTWMMTRMKRMMMILENHDQKVVTKQGGNHPPPPLMKHQNHS